MDTNSNERLVDILARSYGLAPALEKERIEKEKGAYLIKFQASVIDMVTKGAYVVYIPIKKEFQRAVMEFCHSSGLKVRFADNLDTGFEAEVWGWAPRLDEQ